MPSRKSNDRIEMDINKLKIVNEFDEQPTCKMAPIALCPFCPERFLADQRRAKKITLSVLRACPVALEDVPVCPVKYSRSI
jgi:hypothetical protein